MRFRIGLAADFPVRDRTQPAPDNTAKRDNAFQLIVFDDRQVTDCIGHHDVEDLFNSRFFGTEQHVTGLDFGNFGLTQLAAIPRQRHRDIAVGQNPGDLASAIGDDNRADIVFSKNFRRFIDRCFGRDRDDEIAFEIENSLYVHIVRRQFSGKPRMTLSFAQN